VVEDGNASTEEAEDFGEGDEFERWLDEIRGRNKDDGESESR